MPPSNVPERLRRGRPTDRVASMWKWESTKGGASRRPCASMVWPASACRCGSTASLRPAPTPTSKPRPPAGGGGGVPHDQVEHGLGSLLLLASPTAQQDKGHTSGKKIASSTLVEGRPC